MTLSIRDIEWVVCAKFGIERSKFHTGRPRDKMAIARPRQIVMFLARDMLGYSFPRIARYYDRDHTSVMFAQKAVRARIASNPNVAAHVEECRSALSLRAVERHSETLLWAERLKQGIVSWPASAS